MVAAMTDDLGVSEADIVRPSAGAMRIANGHNRTLREVLKTAREIDAEVKPLVEALGGMLRRYGSTGTGRESQCSACSSARAALAAWRGE